MTKTAKMPSKIITTLLALPGTALSAPASAAAPGAVAAAEFDAPAPFDFISLVAAGKIVPANANFGDVAAGMKTKRNVGGVRMSDGVDFTGHVWVSLFLRSSSR